MGTMFARVEYPLIVPTSRPGDVVRFDLLDGRAVRLRDGARMQLNGALLARALRLGALRVIRSPLALIPDSRPAA